MTKWNSLRLLACIEPEGEGNAEDGVVQGMSGEAAR